MRYIGALAAGGAAAAASIWAASQRRASASVHHPAHLVAQTAPHQCFEKLEGAELVQVQVVFR
jgi:hypothetical protein